MAEKIFLTPADRDLLREVVDDVVSQRVNVPSRSGQGQRWNSPETYLAYIPTGGIDAAFSDDPTGTGTDPQDGSLGARECDVYGISGYADEAVFEKIPGLTRMIYNPFPLSVTGDQWVPVTRTKGGSWIVTGTNGAGGSSGTATIVDFVHVVEIVSTGTGSGDPPEWYCEQVTLGASWPPTANPSVTYTGVFESENRHPRILDSSGTATHIIPLYVDSGGRYFIQFWKTETFDDLELASAWTFSFDPVTCTGTLTPTLTTYRFSLDVTTPSDRTTGLTLTVGAV